MPAVPLSQVAVHLRPKTTSPSPPATCRPARNSRSTAAASSSSAASASATRSPCGRSPRARRSTSTARSSASPAQDIAAGEPRPRPQRRRRRLRARLRLLPRLPAAAAAPAEPRYLHGLRPRRRPLRHAQLHRHHQHRQLLGQHQQVHLRALPRRRTCSSSIPNVDGVVAITHKAGCAMQYDGPDHHQLDRTLAGFARHPNVAAYILIGLGCETGQAIHLIENQGLIQLNGSRKKPLGPHHPGVRRHRQDGRGRRAGRRRAAAAGQRRAADDAVGRQDHPRHQLRRLRRQQRRDGQPGPRRRLATCSSRRAAPASSARRRRFTGPSTC